jgi:hypothetical protein
LNFSVRSWWIESRPWQMPDCDFLNSGSASAIDAPEKLASTKLPSRRPQPESPSRRKNTGTGSSAECRDGKVTQNGDIWLILRRMWVASYTR